MRLVILESPYAGNVELNVSYAKDCVKDCLARGESPLASHLLFTQKGILEDSNPEERRVGVKAGHAWMQECDAVVVYMDRGVSNGMLEGVHEARMLNKPVEFRRIYEQDFSSLD